MSQSNYTLIKNDTPGNMRQLEEFISNDTDKISGRIGFIELNSGIDLHFSDNVELVNEKSECLSEASLTISLLLEGQVKFYMNDKPYYLGCNDNEESSEAIGKIWSTTKPYLFSRNFKKGRKVKKIIINIDKEWLADMGLAESGSNWETKLDRSLFEFACTHLNCRDWVPSKQAIKAAEEIIDPPSDADCMKKMIREYRAIELVTLAFEQFTKPVPGIINTKNDTKQNCRLIKVLNFIENNLNADLTLEEIAKSVGFSVSSLQRHFKSTYGATVVDYIRKRKLEMAKDAMINEGVSVSEACFIAGYSNPSSFATAFKRAFGVSPGAIQ
ncbi:MAG: helix-turn-helix transcriptional regulator [Rhizobiales bacterium]|nr:helix-turn-helix transcriptional regulator [Hyphomicrobiales bacterium]